MVFPSDFGSVTNFPFALVLFRDSLTDALLDVFPNVCHGAG